MVSKFFSNLITARFAHCSDFIENARRSRHNSAELSKKLKKGFTQHHFHSMIINMFANFITIKKHKRKFRLFSESGAGITLVEIAVVIFIVALFSTIMISDFPKIQRQFALSRVTYKLSQDLRRTQDLGLSGVRVNDSDENPITVKGYGIYVNLNQSTKQYIIYADVATIGVADQKYNGNFSTSLCSSQTSPTSDCVIEEIIDISKENPSLYIKSIKINNVSFTFTSINFTPPGPIINIDNLSSGNSVGIELSNGSATRTVWVNTSGLIEVQ